MFLTAIAIQLSKKVLDLISGNISKLIEQTKNLMINVNNVKIVFLSVLLLNSLAIGLAIGQSLIFNKPIEHNFEEAAFITFFSGLQLLAITYINHKINKEIDRTHNIFVVKSKRLWRTITISFLFFL